MNERELEAVHCVMHRLEQRWNVLPIPNGEVWHPYDPLPPAMFLALLAQAADLTEGRRFLDLGSGIGRNLALAYHLGWEVAGVEQHEPYFDACREMLPEATLTLADICDLDDFDADVVYMYRPAVEEAHEEAVEAHVAGRLAPGTVLLLPVRPDPVRVI